MQETKPNPKLILTVLLLCAALFSVLVLSKVSVSPDLHAETIEALDQKKTTVMELTAAAALASTAISALPGDTATPIAEQISEVSSGLFIVLCAIFLERSLLTITGYLSFTFLIPMACLLFAIYVHTKQEMLKNLAIKLGIFGIAIFLLVPVSVRISSLIDSTYQATIQQTIQDTQEAAEGLEAEDESLLDQITNLGSSISEIPEKAKTMLCSFVDSTAVLLITSCVIPIATLLLMLYLVKLIFGLNISASQIKKIVPAAKKF